MAADLGIDPTANVIPSPLSPAELPPLPVTDAKTISALPLIRQRAIAQRLWREGAVTVADVANDMQVSKATARRDIDAVVSSGHGIKVHGGAVLHI